MDFRDWRVNHVLSHHLYPNSWLDTELVALEPVLVFVPIKDAKTFFQRYGSYIYSPIIYVTYFLREFAIK